MFWYTPLMASDPPHGRGEREYEIGPLLRAEGPLPQARGTEPLGNPSGARPGLSPWARGTGGRPQRPRTVSGTIPAGAGSS
jgi:hypothetical protein